MAFTLEHYTNLAGGINANRSFLFTDEGGFIGVTLPLAATGDQITAGDAFGISHGEFTEIFNNYDTTAGFTTAHPFGGVTASPFDSSALFLHYVTRKPNIITGSAKQSIGSLSTSSKLKRSVAGATFNLPIDPRAEIVLTMTGPAASVTAGFTFGERVASFADNVTGASGANATGPTGVSVEGFVSRWDPTTLELFLFGVGSTQDLGANAGISGPTAQFDAGFSAAAGGGTVWHSPTAGNLAVGATVHGEISGSTGFEIVSTKTLISTDSFKSRYLQQIVGASYDSYYGATHGLTFGYTGGTFAASSDHVATNTDLRSISSIMTLDLLEIDISHRVAGDNPNHPAYILEKFVRGLSGEAQGPAGTSGGFTLSTIRAGTGGGNATAGVTGTSSVFDQVLVEINNLITIQENSKDTKIAEYENADSIRKTLMIDF